MSLLLPDCLLVLSLLFVRPVADHEWPRRLALHALVLSGCLAAAWLAAGRGAPAERCLVGLSAALLQLAGHAVPVRRGVAAIPHRPAPGGAVVLLAGLALVALAVRTVPDFPATHGLLRICVAATLVGLLGAAVAGSAAGRIGSLLLIGDALILAACALPGTGSLALGTILPLQAALFWTLARTRPALS